MEKYWKQFLVQMDSWDLQFISWYWAKQVYALVVGQFSGIAIGVLIGGGWDSPIAFWLPALIAVGLFFYGYRLNLVENKYREPNSTEEL